MVEPQIVVLVVAGSSPVGHPALQSQNRKLQREFEPDRRKILRSRARQRHRACTASLRLRWFVPGILTGLGAGENNGS
jgi:hypothetical protein